MRILGASQTRADDDLPASGIVDLGQALVVGCGIVLFTGIGAILGHTLFDNVLGWNQDPIVGGGIGLALGVILAFVTVRMVSGSLVRSGN